MQGCSGGTTAAAPPESSRAAAPAAEHARSIGPSRPRATSHPDFHRRSWSSTRSTGRWLRSGRGLSPPVRNYTDPGARVDVSFCAHRSPPASLGCAEADRAPTRVTSSLREAHGAGSCADPVARRRDGAGAGSSVSRFRPACVRRRGGRRWLRRRCRRRRPRSRPRRRRPRRSAQRSIVSRRRRRRRPAARPPPPARPSIAARARAILGRQTSRNCCPPKPGSTVITRSMSSSGSRSR